MDSVLSPENDNRIEEPRNTNPAKAKSGFLFKSVIYFLLLVALVGGVIFAIKQKPELLGLSKAPEESQKEMESLITAVSKIIELPRGETPTIATVSELDKVKDQPFFKNAQQGDKVLVYQNAKKAYLYRPSEKKIIEVGVVNVSEGTSQVAGESTEIPIITPSPLPEEPTVTITPSPARNNTVVEATGTPTLLP